MRRKDGIDRKYYFLSVIVILLSGLLFAPGLHGPFVFDDLTNITFNSYLKIKSLNWESFTLAANSGISGPLGRPISMSTFALDYQVAGNFENTFPFKLTNLLIHLLNGILVFLLFSLLYRVKITGPSKDDSLTSQAILLISLSIALLWIVHPIQINVVHYVVQRMTSLSTTFVLVSLTAYIHGRRLWEQGNRCSYVYLLAISPASLLLGIFSKENAILAVPFMALIEYFYFRESRIWSRLNQVASYKTGFVLGLVLMIGAVFVILYSWSGYTNREFTMAERVLTETRVVAYYLYLIIYPVVSHFGLFHDDIQLSTGLLKPATTLLSIGLIAGLLFFAIRYRKKFPYAAFGIGWFLIAHSLESTVIALELVHEHRNYLALVGPLLVLKPALEQLFLKKGVKFSLTLVSLLLMVVALPTFLRSNDWASEKQLLLAESFYHPNSARAQAGLASILVKHGDLVNGWNAMERAHQLKPSELGYVLNMALISSWSERPVSEALEKKIYQLVKSGRMTPLSFDVIHSAVKCSLSNCKSLYPTIVRLLELCANRPDIPRRKRGQCMYYQGSMMLETGNYRQAVALLQMAFTNDQGLVLALLGIGKAYLELGDLDSFEQLLPKLVSVNKAARYPRDREVKKLINRYEAAKYRIRSQRPRT